MVRDGDTETNMVARIGAGERPGRVERMHHRRMMTGLAECFHSAIEAPELAIVRRRIGFVGHREMREHTLQFELGMCLNGICDDHRVVGLDSHPVHARVDLEMHGTARR